jgi:hypothetical protein
MLYRLRRFITFRSCFWQNDNGTVIFLVEQGLTNVTFMVHSQKVHAGWLFLPIYSSFWALYEQSCGVFTDIKTRREPGVHDENSNGNRYVRFLESLFLVELNNIMYASSFCCHTTLTRDDGFPTCVECINNNNMRNIRPNISTTKHFLHILTIVP